MDKMTIYNIDVKKLRPHPLNPRKQLGDLAELKDSIKKNGIMQNLTVVPDPDKEEGYMIVIGHRRYAAGKKAGLKEFPCVVRTLNESEQVKLMLCENIQRNDLTVMEQAAGFQMMMDFGISVKDIAKDTGFAPSTIYHRLNIAKLDQKQLKKKIDDLTIKDLIELEKIDDIEKRNEILKNADRSNIMQLTRSAYAEQETAKKTELLKERLELEGLKERKANTWDGGVKNVHHITIKPDTDISEIEINAGNEYFSQNYGNNWFTYDIKIEDPEEDAKTREIYKKREEMLGRIEEQIRNLKSRKDEIEGHVAAFEDTVMSGGYVRDNRDAFLTNTIIIIGTTSCYDKFISPENLGAPTRYEHKGTKSEWYEEMRNKSIDAYGEDPVALGFKAIQNYIGRIKFGYSYADFILSGRTNIVDDNGQAEIARMISALEMIGFFLPEDLKPYLTDDNDITRAVEAIREEFRAAREEE